MRRIPQALETLVDYGIVEEVLRPLMSGKEAQIYLVRSGGELRVAKIYKDAEQRSFRQRSEYTEGRTTRNSRDRRAMAKHTRHGREQDEAMWRSAEVNAIYRLSAAGVRVPVPHHFVDGVLVMELVRDPAGEPAPRLGDVALGPAEARQVFDALLATVVRMLCAGVVHGDLSEFNVLMAADGPVVIDFPQAVDPATNQNARKLLIRDVDNLLRFLGRHVRGARPLPYAQEMWDLYQQNLLTPETQLTGRAAASRRPADTAGVLALIGDAARERGRGGPPRGPRGPKVEVIVKPESRASGEASRRGSESRASGEASRRGSESRASGEASRRGSESRASGEASRRGSEGRREGSPRAAGAPRAGERREERPGPTREVRGAAERGEGSPRTSRATAGRAEEPARVVKVGAEGGASRDAGQAAPVAGADAQASRRRRRRRPRGAAAPTVA